MVVSNELFDALLFGLLLLGLGLDAAVPALHGAAFLFACGAALYMAAQEWSEALANRGLWTQESLSTALALSIGGFIYFRGRNGSDFSLLIMSIGLMMASLMVAIATLSACGAVLKTLKPAPLVGYLVTSIGALLMGTLAGLITLETPVFAKAICVALAFAIWKMRERVSPPAQNATSSPATENEPQAAETAASLTESNLSTAPIMAGGAPAFSQRWLIPRRGTTLDRFLPLLILGGLLILLGRESGSFLSNLAPPASANGETINQVQNP
jgi:hypothetical protein